MYYTNLHFASFINTSILQIRTHHWYFLASFQLQALISRAHVLYVQSRMSLTSNKAQHFYRNRTWRAGGGDEMQSRRRHKNDELDCRHVTRSSKTSLCRCATPAGRNLIESADTLLLTTHRYT